MVLSFVELKSLTEKSISLVIRDGQRRIRLNLVLIYLSLNLKRKFILAGFIKRLFWIFSNFIL